MELSYIGTWGARADDLHQAAERVQRSWQLMPGQPGVYSPWGVRHWDSKDRFSVQTVPSDDLAAIAAAIAARTEDVNDGPRTIPGLYMEFVRHHPDRLYQPDDRMFRYDVKCGHLNQRRPMNRVLMTFDPTIGSTADTSATSTMSAPVIRGYLTALVAAWQPDYVAVAPSGFYEAQGHQAKQVRVGWMTYVANSVDLDTSRLPTGIVVEAGDGGRYITLAGTAEEPDLEQALAVRRALGY